MTAAAIAIDNRRTAEDWHRIIIDDLGRAVEGIIAAGLHLREAKDEVGHGEWLPLLKSLKIGERTAQMLMRIAANEALANPNHWFAFPTSWRTLSELATLPPKLLEAKIIDGTITPEIERKDVTALKGKTPAASRLAVDDPDPPAPKPPTAELGRELEARQAHIDELEATRETAPPTEFAPADAEKMRRLEIELEGLRSENEELRQERDRLRARVSELEAALAASGTVQAVKPKRGRPKGSKNKPKVGAAREAMPAP